jgi:hypothetical protein
MSAPVQIVLAGLRAPSHAEAKALIAQAPKAVPCALAELWRLNCQPVAGARA